MSHSKISSTAEPWLLLPLLQMLKKEGTVTNYSHQTCQRAIDDMVCNMRGGRSKYNHLLREFVESVYDSASREGSIYFLDKTPRYYIIIPEIAKLFPDAKFVFLFRNPVHVYASILTSWGDGTFKRLLHYAVDLEEGPVLLSNGYASIKEKAYALQYEEFVQNPKMHLVALLDYLDLEYEELMLSNFATQHPKGRMGDQTGTKEYNRIDVRSLEKWKCVFGNRFRKRVLKNYVLRLPESSLAIQGYDKKRLIEEVGNINTARLTPVQDYYYYYRYLLTLYLKMNLFFAKGLKWAVGKHLS